MTSLCKTIKLKTLRGSLKTLRYDRLCPIGCFISYLENYLFPEGSLKVNTTQLLLTERRDHVGLYLNYSVYHEKQSNYVSFKETLTDVMHLFIPAFFQNCQIFIKK